MPSHTNEHKNDTRLRIARIDQQNRRRSSTRQSEGREYEDNPELELQSLSPQPHEDPATGYTGPVGHAAEEQPMEPMRREVKPLVHSRPAYDAPVRRPMSPLPPIINDVPRAIFQLNVQRLADHKAFLNPLVQKTALKEIEKIPDMWGPKGRANQTTHYGTVAWNIFRRTGVYVTPKQVNTNFGLVKTRLKRKMKASIEKLHGYQKMEAELFQWPLYPYIRFIRRTWVDFEKDKRDEVSNLPIVLEEDDDDMDDFRRRPALENFVELEDEEEVEVDPETFEELNEATMDLPAPESPDHRGYLSELLMQEQEHQHQHQHQQQQQEQPQQHQQQHQQQQRHPEQLPFTQMQQQHMTEVMIHRRMQQLQQQMQQEQSRQQQHNFARPAQAMVAPGVALGAGFGRFPGIVDVPANDRAGPSSASPAGLGGQVPSSSASPRIPAQQPPAGDHDHEDLSDMYHWVPFHANRVAQDLTRIEGKVLRAGVHEVLFCAELQKCQTLEELFTKLYEKHVRRR